MEKINVAELLRNCPKGMELDCIIFNGKVYFEGIDDNNSAYPIKISVNLVNIEHLDIYGQYNNRDYSKCVIYPKGKTTWEGFQIPFKNGDIVAFDSKLGTQIFLFKEYIYDHNYAQCYMMLNCSGDIDFESRCYFVERFATKEEKEKLFKAIKDNGYKWNPETNTLEKLVEPKFKVGDRVRKEDNNSRVYTINGVYSSMYGVEERDFGILIEEQDDWVLVPTIVPKFKVGDRIRKKNSNEEYLIISINEYTYYYSLNENCTGSLRIQLQDDYELVPKKFDVSKLKPFDKVLTRQSSGQIWNANLFSHKIYKKLSMTFVCLGGYCPTMCIPYEGNEHLLGTSIDCDDFYKTWAN